MSNATKQDRLDVLSSTKTILDRSEFVKINKHKLEELSSKVKKRIKEGLPDRDEEFFSLGKYEDDVQVVFLENVVNFCFWAEKGKEKWKAEFNGKEDDGASALRIVFERAISDKMPILNADHLEKLTLKDTKELFKPSNGIEIPLIEKRHENLVEAGRILNEYFKGQFTNLIKESNYDAVEIAKNTVKYFKSFNDSYNGINFYKRAQLNAYDIAEIPDGQKIVNTEGLTAMADYKLPQLLRFLGVLEYSEELANKIDDWELIKAGSREELEIRSATIWAIELVSERLGITVGLADRAIWWLSRELDINQLYHRTYSIYY